MLKFLKENGEDPENYQTVDFDMEQFEKDLEDFKRQTRIAEGEAILLASRTILTD